MYIECIVQEGGDAMISYLCQKIVLISKKAYKPNYHEWSYRDLLCLFKSEHKQWFKACKAELDMLKQGKFFQVTDCPSSQKVINTVIDGFSMKKIQWP